MRKQPGSGKPELRESTVTAESVENAENTAQRRLLTSHHCDFVQGCLFSKPQSAADVPAFVRGNALA